MDTFKEYDLVLVKSPVLPEGERWLIITSIARNWIAGVDGEGKSWTILKSTITSARAIEMHRENLDHALEVASAASSYEDAVRTLRDVGIIKDLQDSTVLEAKTHN